LRKLFVAAVAALPLLFAAGTAQADETLDKLVASCKAAGSEDPATCECQAKALVANADPRFITAMLAMEAGKSEEEALKEAGITKEEFDKLATEATTKAQPEMEKCKTATP